MLPKSGKLIIELYGEPGAGKSTLTKALVSEYGFVAIPPNLKRIHYLTLSLRYPRTVLAWVPLIFQNFRKAPSVYLLRYNTSLLFSSLQKIHDAKQSAADRVVVDEGLVQRFLSYSDVAHPPQTIAKLLRQSPRGDTIVLVNDREVSKDRYTTAHARANRGEAYLTEWKNNLKKNLEQLRTVLEQNSTISHHETKNQPIDGILHEINGNNIQV